MLFCHLLHLKNLFLAKLNFYTFRAYAVGEKN
jgi:hypothetical protein